MKAETNKLSRSSQSERNTFPERRFHYSRSGNDVKAVDGVSFDSL